MAIVDWPGQSGRTYRYHTLARVTADGILSVAGNYAFVKQLANGNYLPLYFGQAEDLQSRLPCHERWAEAVRLGATEVQAHSTQGGELVRCAEERDLIQRWDPPLNTQHRRVV